jgi:hypothetical protein
MGEVKEMIWPSGLPAERDADAIGIHPCSTSEVANDEEDDDEPALEAFGWKCTVVDEGT